MHLKPDTAAELTKTFEERVLPILRKQEGFKDEIVCVSTDRTEAIGISFWDRKENAETYSKAAYAQVLQAMTNVLDGTPQVKVCEVVSSSLQKIAAQTTVV